MIEAAVASSTRQALQQENKEMNGGHHQTRQQSARPNQTSTAVEISQNDGHLKRAADFACAGHAIEWPESMELCLPKEVPSDVIMRKS
jgi:hypothetical protein